MATEIRRYAERDRERLRRLAHDPFDSDARADAYFAHLVDQARNGAVTLLVAEDGDALTGCVAVSAPVAVGDDDEASGSYAMISDLYVVPSRRRSGLGRALTRRAEREALQSGATRVALKVLSANDAALRFYRSAGYDDRFVVLERDLNTARDEKPA